MLRGVNEVANFARRMVHTLSLPKNASKPGWKECEIGELENKLEEEYREAMVAIAQFRTALYNPLARQGMKEDSFKELQQRVAEEATDLGCVAMMITDLVGGLDE